MALNDCTFDDAPDVPARPVDQLAALVRQADIQRDQNRHTAAGHGLGATLTCVSMPHPATVISAGRR
ncbi:MAG: hypothetical protein ACRDRZ_01785 [Pseudonocardiaceae bacterium]